MTIPTPLLQLLKMFQGCSICSLIPTRNWDTYAIFILPIELHI
jgi:hypothetical protein